MPVRVGHVYGPVPSRRLGYSLGIDVVPHKTCNLNCIYCQLGPTPKLTMARREYVTADTIIEELRGALRRTDRIDYIAFSGSGEPLLNNKIGDMIRRTKAMTKIPVAVLTNGALLYLPEVRTDLQASDVVMPSLDAASDSMFRRINRPHPGLQISTIITGLKKFRSEYSGRIWLEILFVRGVNDSETEIEALRRAVEEIGPDRVDLNTVIRPPAEPGVEPVSQEDLVGIQLRFGETAEVVPRYRPGYQKAYWEDTEEAILSLVSRRPATIEELLASLGCHRNELIKHVASLLNAGRIEERAHGGRRYYTIHQSSAVGRQHHEPS
jgi:wyosine [tRNA(Phe)-imidazoG37] synthetase (radical SAM superfamily)